MIVRSSSPGFPAELLRRSVPRHVVLTAAGKTTVIVAVALILGGIAAGVGVRVAAERAREMQQTIAHESVATDAVVTDVVRRKGKDKQDTVRYRYVAESREYAGAVRMRKRASARIVPGTRLRIEYLASSPAMSWLAGRPPQGVPLWLAPLVAIPMVTTGVVLLVVVNRRRRLLTYGRATEARITGSKRFSHGSHGGRGYHVDFEFRLLSGARRTGRFDVHKDPPPDGAIVVIVYDPDEPGRLMRYPATMFTIG